jgi:hypothetical protein
MPEAERTAVIRTPTDITIRKTDGALFEPSHPGYCDISSFWTGGSPFFFRRIVPLPKRWWQGQRWQRTGETWQPLSGEFNVVRQDGKSRPALVEAMSKEVTHGQA